IMFDMHEDTSYALRYRLWVPPVLRRVAAWGWDLLERILLRNRPVILAEESYRRRRPWLRRAVVVRNFPTSSLLSRTAPECSDGITVQVVYLGAVSKARGGHLFVPLARALAERHDGRVAVVVIGPCGDADLRRELEDATGAGLITWHDRMPADHAWEKIASADVGLALLADEPNYRHSYPTKFLEYAALGLRV